MTEEDKALVRWFFENIAPRLPGDVSIEELFSAAVDRGLVTREGEITEEGEAYLRGEGGPLFVRGIPLA